MSRVCVSLFSPATSVEMGGNALKLHQGMFRLDIRIFLGYWTLDSFFTKRVVEQWNTLPKGGEESPSLEGFKRLVGVALGDVIYFWI